MKIGEMCALLTFEYSRRGYLSSAYITYLTEQLDSYVWDNTQALVGFGKNRFYTVLREEIPNQYQIRSYQATPEGLPLPGPDHIWPGAQQFFKAPFNEQTFESIKEWLDGLGAPEDYLCILETLVTLRP